MDSEKDPAVWTASHNRLGRFYVILDADLLDVRPLPHRRDNIVPWPDIHILDPMPGCEAPSMVLGQVAEILQALIPPCATGRCKA